MTGTEIIDKLKSARKPLTDEQKTRLAENKRKWRLENPERDREINRRSYEKRDKKEAAEYTKQYRLTHVEQVKITNKNVKLKRQYGITLFEYTAMLEKQNGVCAICGKPETKWQRRGSCKTPTPDSLHVDHSHATGKVRGLICNYCNLGIGALKDDPELLRKAASYIEERS